MSTLPGLNLDTSSLRSLISPITFQRGVTVQRNAQVLSYEAAPESAREWLLKGQVLGSDEETYSTEVNLELSPQGKVEFFDGQCTCPVGTDCKHSVALALHAAAKASEARANVSVGFSPYATPEERAVRAAHRQVEEWIDRFQAAAPVQDVPSPSAAKSKPRQQNDHYVYLLKPQLNGTLTELVLGFATSHLLRGGQWAKAKPPRHPPYPGTPVYQDATPDDHETLRLILALSRSSYSFEGTLVGTAGTLALETAAKTGRLFWTDSSMSLEQALAWGEPRSVQWQWQAAHQRIGQDVQWLLTGSVTDRWSEPTVYANTPPLYVDLKAGVVGRAVSDGTPAEQLALLLQMPPVPESAFASPQGELLRSLAGLPLPPVVKPPQALPAVTPTWHLQLTRVTGSDVVHWGLVRVSLSFDYAGHRQYWPHQQRQVMVTRAARDAGSDDQADRGLLTRDLSSESAARDVLFELGFQAVSPGQLRLSPQISDQRWLAWADDDFALLANAGFQLDVDPALQRWIARADSLSVTLDEQGEATDGLPQAWFDLSLGMEINGERQNILPWLPTLLQHLRGVDVESELPAHLYLHQPDGNYLRIPTAPLQPWVQALLDLVGERGSPFEGEHIRLSRLEALRMGAVLGDGVPWQGAEALKRMVRQLGGHEKLPQVPPPTGLNATLRPYQQHGLNWLQFLASHGLSGVLADDMGLGKTLQTLAHVLVEKQQGRLTNPVLIVTPVSLLGNWRREAERFTPDLRVMIVHGKDRHAVVEDIGEHDVVIAPYSLLPRDRETWLKRRWHLVALDEAQNIKNASTYAAQVVNQLDTQHRLCLSGTPMENHLGELWSLFHFLMPGFLGGQTKFKTLFRTPIEKHGDAERLEQLRRRVTPFMLRRTKRDVAAELPDKIETVSSVELTGKQADLYETIRLTTEATVRQALADRGLARSQIQILDALLKLRQVCCDPRLLNLPSARQVRQSAKLEHLMEILPEMLAEGRRVLLFSQFTSMLELIEDELRTRNLPWVKLTGQSQRRDAIIERFTSGEVPLFLISLKAGGVGLNLPQADTVIHYDPWWNPAVENQATDRAHRIGQTNQVFVYKLVAQGTIEERILALQSRKAELTEAIYEGSLSRDEPLFSADDVAELLRPLG